MEEYDMIENYRRGRRRRRRSKSGGNKGGGNVTVRRGGGNCNRIFENISENQNYEYIGCFGYNRDDKSSSGKKSNNIILKENASSVLDCYNELIKYNDKHSDSLSYFGLKNGKQCIAGYTEYNLEKSDRLCGMPCDNMDTCGGQLADSIYKIKDKPKYNYVGCFNKRVNELTKMENPVKSLDECYNQIIKHNDEFPDDYYDHFALIKDKCHGAYESYEGKQNAENRCIFKCKSREFCGGRNFASVFKLNEDDNYIDDKENEIVDDNIKNESSNDKAKDDPPKDDSPNDDNKKE